jgi:hypothetical protein
MAYPTVDKPYGLKPINLIGGQVFAGATRQRRIASSAASIGSRPSRRLGFRALR